MALQTYRITPRDLLFFRDGRPLDLNKQDKEHRNIGHGAYWPRPDHLYNAIMHALIGSRTAGEKAAFGQFGGLQVAGPFPLRKNEKGGETLYLPRPLDWDCLLEEMPEGKTDAPEFLRHGVIDRADGKKDSPPWISLADYSAYLSADLSSGKLGNRKLDKPALFKVEPRIGNTIDADTGASKRIRDKSRSGQYEAQSLRLEKDVSMWAAADVGRDNVSIPSAFVMGGQGFLVDFDCDGNLPSLAARLPKPAVNGGGKCLVRWTLLTPALFEQTGWLPGWVDVAQDGKVRLKEREVKRDAGEPREQWKARQAQVPELDGVHLDAACIGKAVVFSGYDAVDGVKPTRLAVSAGSCYIFRCDNGAAAKSLIDLLHLTRKSDFGSQGFGMGVCSIVKAHQP